MDTTVLGEALFTEFKPHLKLTGDKKNIRLYGKLFKPDDLNANIPDSIREIYKLYGSIPNKECDEIKHYFIEKLNSLKPTDLSPKYRKFQIGLDVLTGKLYCLENGGLMPWFFDAWKSTVPEEQYEILYQNRIEMVVAFNPHKGLSWSAVINTTDGPKTYPHFNTYIRPDWMRHQAPDSFEIVEKYIPAFLEHFIPCEKERNYVVHWLYSLAFRRCQDVLVLIGTQGNGKNTLMELATIIAGKHNTIIGSKAFGKEKFNGEVFRRKLVNLDEYSIKGNAKESMKCFCNDDITVEHKGVDPQTFENHCSFIVANNSIKSVDFEYKDRRFTCPTLGKRDLSYVWPEEKLLEFRKIIQSEEFKIAFPYWIIEEVKHKGLEYPDARAYITPYFHTLTETSKPEWFKTFKRLLTVKHYVNAADIYKQTRTRVSDDKIMDHLTKEHEERLERGIEPQTIAFQIISQEGKVNYVSKLFSEEEEGDLNED
jgi:hypothetical protein